MAKKRTKKERITAELHRSAREVSLTPKPQEVEEEKNYLATIFAYDPKLIIKDLKKTLLVVSLILLVLLTIALLYT